MRYIILKYYQIMIIFTYRHSKENTVILTLTLVN